jgi:hypothetical protein
MTVAAQRFKKATSPAARRAGLYSSANYVSTNQSGKAFMPPIVRAWSHC